MAIIIIALCREKHHSGDLGFAEKHCVMVDWWRVEETAVYCSTTDCPLASGCAWRGMMRHRLKHSSSNPFKRASKAVA